mgnify:FL=1
MGKQVYLRKIRALFEKSPVVDFKSIRRIVGTDYAKLLVLNLFKKGEIKKLGKGFYTKHNENSLAVFYYAPAYIGLQSAITFYKLWDQATLPVIITTKKTRRGVRKILDSNILVRNISKRYFFGFKYLQDHNFFLP